MYQLAPSPLHSICCGHLVSTVCQCLWASAVSTIGTEAQPVLWESPLYSETQDSCTSFKALPQTIRQSIAVFKHSTIWTWFLYFKNTKVNVNVVEEKLAYSFGSYSLETVGLRRINPGEWTGFLQRSLISWLGLEYILSFIICFRQ